MVAAFHVGKVPPALPSIREGLDASLGQAGWLLSTVNLISAVGGMALALSADRFGHRRLVILGTALCLVASVGGAFAGSVELLLACRVIEGLGFITVVVSIPTLVLRIAAASDQRIAMAFWSTYMPTGAGSMMLVAALILPFASWRGVWLVAAAASAAMLVALLLGARSRQELDRPAAGERRLLKEMGEVATSGGPLAIALCFGAYSCCWFVVVGFLPTLLIERLGVSASTAAIVTALVTIVNIAGNLAGGLLLQRGFARRTVILGATLPMALCAAGIFLDGVPDLMRLVLAGVYSAVIGAVPSALFTAIPVHAPRPPLVGAATGLLMQGSNIGGLIGPPITAALVSAGGWANAAWLTSVALATVSGAGIFLHWRERRKLAA